MKFWGITVGILIAVGVIGGIVLAQVHTGDNLTPGQKQKALTNLLGRAPVLSPVDHTKWSAYTSSVVAFAYPSWATVYTKDNTQAKTNPLILDSFHFGLLDEYSEGIVSVTNRPDFSLVSDEPAVRLRLQDSEYQEIENSSTAVAFLKTTNGLEASFFTLRNGKVYSLIISGGSQSDATAVFQRMKESLRYK